MVDRITTCLDRLRNTESSRLPDDPLMVVSKRAEARAVNPGGARVRECREFGPKSGCSRVGGANRALRASLGKREFQTARHGVK